MKGPLATIIVLFGAFAAFFGWYLWDSSSNRGFELGYFGEFNRVSKAVTSIPGVSISKSWYNGDITLEEFGLSLSVAGKPLELFFSETDPVRTMRHEAAVAALETRIKAELAPGKGRQPNVGDP